MKREEIEIGTVFYSATSKWICTDKGTRFIIATQFFPGDSEEDFEISGHHTFDAFDLEGCYPSEEEALRIYGESLRLYLNQVRKTLDEDEFDPKYERLFRWRTLGTWKIRPYRDLQISTGSLKGRGWLIVDFSVSRKGDHPGWVFVFMLLKRGVSIEYSDCRHLDSKTGRLY